MVTNQFDWDKKCFFTRVVLNLENYMVYLGARRFHVTYLCLAIGINVFKTLI